MRNACSVIRMACLVLWDVFARVEQLWVSRTPIEPRELSTVRCLIILSSYPVGTRGRVYIRIKPSGILISVTLMPPSRVQAC